MRYLPFVLAALALVVFAPPASAEDHWSFDSYLKQHNTSDWDGLGVGSMVHRKGFQEMSMPQMPAPQRQETEEKKTLVKITDEDFVIKVEQKQMGAWQTEEKTEPKKKNWTHKVEELGTETVTIEDTEYECSKKKVQWMDGETAKDTAVLYVNEKLGIVKMLVGDDQGVEIVVTKLDQEWTVGDVTLKGREMAMTIPTPMGKLSGTMRLCPEVPDATIRQEIKSGQGPMQMHQVTELVAFVKK